MEVQPYLNFDGRCEEAIEFYRGALGAEVIMLVRNKENPEPPPPNVIPPEAADKILHVSLRIGDSTVMASDGMCQGERSVPRHYPVPVRRGRSRGRAAVQPPCPTADRCACRWPRPSFPRPSVW